LFDHENSKVNRDCLEFVKWYELTLRLHIHQTIDKGIQDIMDKERKKWRVIIRKIIDVILFLSKINFRDHREEFDSQKQGNNFLETVKIIAEYNPCMTEHLSDTQVSKKRTSTYLSPNIQHQLI